MAKRKSRQSGRQDLWKDWAVNDTPQAQVDYLSPTLQQEFDKSVEVAVDKSTVYIQPQGLEAYFRKISELADSGQEFPADLDEVWMLAYPRKDHAVRELKNNFLESIDYQVFPKNEENPLGGRPKEIYELSVPCLEYFIARRVPEVFNVYRQVFHRVRQQMQTPAVISADHIIAIGQRMKELELKIELDKPKVAFAETVNTNKRAITMQEFSKILFDKNGIDIGRNDLLYNNLSPSGIYFIYIIMMGNFESE